LGYCGQSELVAGARDEGCASGKRTASRSSCAHGGTEDTRAYRRGVVLDFSRPGKPTDNASIESLNGKFRAECLNARWFTSIDEMRGICEDWRGDYNKARPYSALGNKPPMALMNCSGQHGPSRAAWPGNWPATWFSVGAGSARRELVLEISGERMEVRCFIALCRTRSPVFLRYGANMYVRPPLACEHGTPSGTAREHSPNST